LKTFSGERKAVLSAIE